MHRDRQLQLMTMFSMCESSHHDRGLWAGIPLWHSSRTQLSVALMIDQGGTMARTWALKIIKQAAPDIASKLFIEYGLQ